MSAGHFALQTGLRIAQNGGGIQRASFKLSALGAKTMEPSRAEVPPLLGRQRQRAPVRIRPAGADTNLSRSRQDNAELE